MKKNKGQKSSDQQQDQQKNSRDKQSQKQQHALSMQSNRQLYLSQINPIHQDSQEFEAIKAILENNGFNYSDLFSFDFYLKKVKNSGEGVKYQVQYGHFRTFLYAIFTLYDFTSIQRQAIGLGRFGNTLSFQYEGQLIVTKQFSMKETVFDMIIKEVFMVKLASALKIGAKFRKIYGFDIIVLNDSCQYLTERCQDIGYSNLMQKQFQQTLAGRIISIARIMHSLSIIHGDIKPEHIMWSNQHQEFILIDFGMSLFVKEKLGQKTLTNYFGTFSYSSKQMKKSFYLGSKINVDLFYNDLYAINKTLSECISIYRPNTQVQQKKIIHNIGPIYCQWRLVVEFFKFIFFIDEESMEEAVQIAKKVCILSQCFRQIIRQKIKYIVNQFAKKSYEQWMVRQFKPKQAINYEIKENSLSPHQIIYIQVLKNGDKFGYINYHRNFDQMNTIINNNGLCYYIEAEESIETLFSYIFQRKSYSNEEIKKKKQIIKKIYLLKISKIPQTQILMNRSVLLLFQKYFYNKHALNKLQIIQNIFRLTCEFRYLKQVQENICQIFLQNPQRWINQFYCGLTDFFEINKNPRMSWQWLITKSKLYDNNNNKKFNQFIKLHSDLLLKDDRKLSSWYIKLPYKETQQQISIINKIKLKFPRQKYQINAHWLYQKQKYSLTQKLGFHKTQICMFEHYLLEGTRINTIKYTYFMKVLPYLDFILRETIWTTVYLAKNECIKKFEACMEEIFNEVFIGDIFEGIDMFVRFRFIFEKVIKKSKIMKKLVLKFVSSIQMKKILQQIQDDPYSLKELIILYIELTDFFLSIESDSNSKDRLRTLLDSFFKEIKIFIQSSDKWWVSEGSQIILALQISELYYATKKATFQHSPAYINQMLMLAKKVCQGYSCDFSISRSQLQSNDLVLLSFVFGAISQSVQYCTNCYIDQIWQIFKSIGSDFILFKLLTSDQSLFLKIIHYLCEKQQFQECFSVLQSYGRQAKTEIKFFDSSNLSVFHKFAYLLPENTIRALFIEKIDKFSLKRMGQSPRISIILIFLLHEKSFLFNQQQKLRYIKLISFGISLIQVRYQNFLWINGCLLRLHRCSIKLINHRKQRIHYRVQARILDDKDLYQKLLIKKKNKCLKIKECKAKYYLLDRISKENNWIE